MHTNQANQQNNANQVDDDNEWNELYGVKKRNLNRRDMILAVGSLFLELSKIVISSLLTVFVPQNCDGQTCSIRENFIDLTDLNKATLGWNFITLGFMIILYIVIYKRETFLIYKLDEDPTVPKTNIRNVFKNHNEIANGVLMHNSRMKWAGIAAGLIYLVNVILSAVLIFGYYYDGYQSVIQYIVNAALCCLVLYRSIAHSLATESSGLVISNANFSPLVYNQIDKTYEKSKNMVPQVYIDTNI